MKRELTEYEKAGRLLRLLGWLALAAAICFALATVAFALGTKKEEMAACIASMLVAVGLCVLYLVIGKAVKEHKAWGRVAGIVLGIFSLTAIPIGTIIGVYLLWCLIGKWEAPQKQIDEAPSIVLEE